MSWGRALAVSQGKARGEFDDDEMERQVQEMAEKLRKHLGSNLIRKPHILAEALSVYHPGLPRRLMEHVEWQDDLQAVADGYREDPDMEEFDF